MDHPLVHPCPSGTRWLRPDSILISPYHQANRPCTVTSSHEPAPALVPLVTALVYTTLDAPLSIYCCRVALAVTLYD